MPVRAGIATANPGIEGLLRIEIGFASQPSDEGKRRGGEPPERPQGGSGCDEAEIAKANSWCVVHGTIEATRGRCDERDDKSNDDGAALVTGPSYCGRIYIHGVERVSRHSRGRPSWLARLGAADSR